MRRLRRKGGSAEVEFRLLRYPAGPVDKIRWTVTTPAWRCGALSCGVAPQAHQVEMIDPAGHASTQVGRLFSCQEVRGPAGFKADLHFRRRAPHQEVVMFKGAYTALITPFTSGQEVDQEGLEKLVAFQIWENGGRPNLGSRPAIFQI